MIRQLAQQMGATERGCGTVPVRVDRIATAIANLDAWLETMRGPNGYGGPVVHWWQQSLLYTGAGLDWRYEGIIAGYLLLWERTGDARWLDKARRAADDLVAGQLPDGHYPASAFEINPATAGTPHEAACDVGLLLLAHALRRGGRCDWELYAACAERNLRRFTIGQLWDEETRSFRDTPRVPSFVPNKAATACEALFLLAELAADDEVVARYALPTLQRVLAYQVHRPGALAGAIAQNSYRGRVVEAYFPLYIARCVPALIRGYGWTGDACLLDGAIAAMEFIARWTMPDGSIPTVIYPNRRVVLAPSWLAPLGDILRAVDGVRPFGFDADFSATVERLMAAQDMSGGVQTATGFAGQASGEPAMVPEVRDVIHVVGWCDKAFRYLAAHVGTPLPAGVSQPFATACTFRGRRLELIETPTVIEVTDQGTVCYRWRKGQPWAEVAWTAFWLR